MGDHSLNKPQQQSKEQADYLTRRLKNLAKRLANTYVAVGRPVPDDETLAIVTSDLAIRFTDEQIIAALARVRLGLWKVIGLRLSSVSIPIIWLR